RYQLLMTKDSPFGQRHEITWGLVSQLPLCLLTSDTQNRQIIESLLRGAGGNPRITLESDSMIVLFAHVRTGAWASVVPDKSAQSTRVSTRALNPLPTVAPGVGRRTGLSRPWREPMTPLAAALAAEARRVASTLPH